MEGFIFSLNIQKLAFKNLAKFLETKPSSPIDKRNSVMIMFLNFSDGIKNGFWKGYISSHLKKRLFIQTAKQCPRYLDEDSEGQVGQIGQDAC